MPRKLTLLPLLVLLTGCATHYYPAPDSDGVYYARDDARYARPSRHVYGAGYYTHYPWWSLDYMYFASGFYRSGVSIGISYRSWPYSPWYAYHYPYYYPPYGFGWYSPFRHHYYHHRWWHHGHYAWGSHRWRDHYQDTWPNRQTGQTPDPQWSGRDRLDDRVPRVYEDRYSSGGRAPYPGSWGRQRQDPGDGIASGSGDSARRGPGDRTDVAGKMLPSRAEPGTSPSARVISAPSAQGNVLRPAARPAHSVRPNEDRGAGSRGLERASRAERPSLRRKPIETNDDHRRRH